MYRRAIQEMPEVGGWEYFKKNTFQKLLLVAYIQIICIYTSTINKIYCTPEKPATQHKVHSEKDS